MLAIPLLREETERVVLGLTKKGIEDAASKIAEILQWDDSRKAAQTEADELRSRQKALSEQVGGLMKAGKREESEAIKAEVAQIKSALEAVDARFEEAEQTLFQLLVVLPNVPSEAVPQGRTPEDNEVVLEWGAKPALPAEALPHWDLIKKYDIIDFELGNKISGAGFPVYKGKGAKLQRALINFFLDQAEAAGYKEVQPPIVINADSGYGTGQLPDKEGQMYHVEKDELYLIPTAEVPITNIFRDVILTTEELPQKMVGYTPCFRREAGSWGAHVRGLNRLHQFDKVEIVQVRDAADSYAALEEMSVYVQSLLQKLGLPYRVLKLCGGDMSFSSALTYDMETWSAAQGRWLEVSSVSNFETFQANRLKLRVKVDKKTRLLHTLNGSALALPRIVATLLENNQTPEGIRIPEVLVPYCGFDWIK